MKDLANIKSAEKHARTSAKRAKRNKVVKSEIKSLEKSINTAINNGETEKAEDLFKKYDKRVKQAIHRNIIHKNAASRYIGRLQRKINKAK